MGEGEGKEGVPFPCPPPPLPFCSHPIFPCVLNAKTPSCGPRFCSARMGTFHTQANDILGFFALGGKQVLGISMVGFDSGIFLVQKICARFFFFWGGGGEVVDFCPEILSAPCPPQGFCHSLIVLQ